MHDRAALTPGQRLSTSRGGRHDGGTRHHPPLAVKIALILNARAGHLLDQPAEKVLASLSDRLAAGGGEVIRELAAHSDLMQAVDEAAAGEAEAVVVGGGDGTVAAVAGRLAGTGTALGIVPFGTLNLMARDLGIPTDPLAAAEALVAGEVRTIDIAEVNGQVFLCNSVLGLVPEVAAVREEHRGSPWWRKWAAMARAAFEVFREYPKLSVVVDRGEGPQQLETRAIAVANNPYRAEFGAFLARDRLDTGCLAVYVFRQRTRWAMLLLAARLVLGTWKSDQEVEEWQVSELTVARRRRRRRRRLLVANDGEILSLKPPLVYRVRPQALKVLVPHARDAATPASAGHYPDRS